MRKVAHIWVLMAQPLVHWGNNLACSANAAHTYLCNLQPHETSYMHDLYEGVNLGSGKTTLNCRRHDMCSSQVFCYC